VPPGNGQITVRAAHRTPGPGGLSAERLYGRGAPAVAPIEAGAGPEAGRGTVRAMEYRQLGRSGLRVSTITLGTMGFGGTGWAAPVGQIDLEGARRQIGLARDAGVNLFDTADVYSHGLSEEILEPGT
jgi:hypothetical protein